MKFKEFIMKKMGMVKESPDHWYRAELDRNDDDDNDNNRNDDDNPLKKIPVPEPPKPSVPTFKSGDILVLSDTKKSNKIPDDAWDFLMTFKEYKVIKVSDTGKLDLGCHISKNTPEGGVEKIYLFSPKRFSLKNASDSPIKSDDIDLTDIIENI